jgi:hypothetical protein
LQGGGARHGAGEDTQRVTHLYREYVTKAESNQKSGDDCHKGQQIVPAAYRPGHSLEKLPPVENADTVEKHDQAGEADRSCNLRFWRKGANGQPDEQHSAHPERKSANADLTDEVTDTDGEERCQNGLRSNDVTRESKHDSFSSPGLVSVRGSRLRGTARSPD